MKYELTHLTRYRYGTMVDLSHQCLRLRPPDLRHQTVTGHDLRIEPTPTSRDAHRDHFGNAVDLVALELPHDAFAVTAHAFIEVTRKAETRPGPAWESLRDALDDDGFPDDPAAAEFVYPSPLVPRQEPLAAYARLDFEPDRPIVDAARALTHRIRTEFTYVPGATTIATPLAEVFKRRQGVCQDFAHVMIGMLRALGLAARYVSGYIRTYHDEKSSEWRGADASHAWVAVWCGEELGWIEFDPTNDLIVADEHIVLAYGRDFSDVSPLRGILLGGGMHNLEVAVAVKPLG